MLHACKRLPETLSNRAAQVSWPLRCQAPPLSFSCAHGPEARSDFAQTRVTLTRVCDRLAPGRPLPLKLQRVALLACWLAKRGERLVLPQLLTGSSRLDSLPCHEVVLGICAWCSRVAAVGQTQKSRPAAAGVQELQLSTRGEGVPEACDGRDRTPPWDTSVRKLRLGGAAFLPCRYHQLVLGYLNTRLGHRA